MKVKQLEEKAAQEKIETEGAAAQYEKDMDQAFTSALQNHTAKVE